MRARHAAAAVLRLLPLSFPTPRYLARVAATLLLALAAAGLCLWLHTPLPWMIGPLLAVSIALDAGGGGLPFADRARIVRALMRVGLDEDARAFAYEGLVIAEAS